MDDKGRGPGVWQIIGLLVVVLIAVSVVGFVLKALKFLVMAALVIFVLVAVVGASGRKKP